MSKYLNFLNVMDFVGYYPTIYFQKENKYKTIFGGIFTIIITILTILTTISFGRDIYERSDPTILLNKKFIDPERNVTQELIIGYRLFYTGGIRIEDLDKMVDIFLLHSIFDPKLSKATLTRFEMIKCREANIYKKNYLNVTSLMGNPDDYFCLPNNLSIYLKGKYGAPINNHMHLRIAMCKNSTENNNKCYSDDVIRKKMSSFFVSFIFRDSFIDAADFQDPVKYYITSNTLKSSAYTFRQDAYLYKDVTFMTDIGIILPDTKYQDYVQLDTISSGSTAELTTEIFTNVIVGLNNLEDMYNRKYIKMQDVSAQVGGLIKFFLIFADFFLTFYSYIPFLESLYRKIYDYNTMFVELQKNNGNNKNIELKNIFHTSQSPLQNIGNSNFVYVNWGKSGNIHSNSKLKPDGKKCNYQILKNSNIVYRSHSFLEIIFRSCCKKKKKFLFMEKMSEHYKETYDIENLFLNDLKLKSLWKYTFSSAEEEVIKLFSTIKFYEKYQSIEQNNNDLIESHNVNSNIFSKLKIPMQLFNDKIINNHNQDNKLMLSQNNNINE